MRITTIIMSAVLLTVSVSCGAGQPAAAGGEGQTDLSAKIAAAPRLNVEKVATPIRATRGGRSTWVPNPDGKTWDLLIRYYNDYWGPHTTFIIDLGTGEVNKFLRPHSLYAHALVGPDGKLYSIVTGDGGAAFQVYDPATNAISDLKEIAKDVGGETKPLCLGTDGYIYGAGSKKGRACIYRLDTKSGKITTYGRVGPSHAPNRCWGYSVAADDRYVYVASGKIPWYLVAYDRQTGKDTVLLTCKVPKGYIWVGQRRHGCEASVRLPGGKVKRYWLYKGKAIPIKGRKEAPPWNVPEDSKPWITKPARPTISLGKPDKDGKCELWYKPVDAKAKMPANMSAGAKPEDMGWKVVRFTVPTYPYPITSITALPDGRICGSGGDYLGNFLYDPKTDTCEHKGIIGLSHGGSTVAGGKVYMSGYPSSALYVYDPDKPWTAGVAEKPWLKPLPVTDRRINPHRLTYLSHHGSGCHKMKTAVTGGDGKVYFGGTWHRDGNGGGLGWWDVQAGKPGGVSLPFRNYQIHYITTAADGRYVVISTFAVRDAIGGKPRPKEARLFVFDTTQMKLVRDFVPVKGVLFTGPVAGTSGPFVLGITYNPADGKKQKTSLIYKVNVETGQVVWTKTLPYPAGFRPADHRDGFDFSLGPDGKVWTYTGGKFVPVNPEKNWWNAYLSKELSLIRIDPDDGAIEVVGKINQTGEMAFSGRDLYLSGGDRYLDQKSIYLRRIRNVVPVRPDKGSK